jgi:hypothetical protein
VANIKEDNEFYIHRLLTSKRKDAKISTIYDILKHFMVKPILSYGKNEVCIEVTGHKLNIELAEYVSEFLDRELDRLWDEYKKEHKLKGLKAKNSFFYGLAHGYNQKMNKVEYSSAERNALIQINNKLDQAVDRIYRRLGSSYSQSSRDNNSYQLGKSAGKNLNINKGLKNKSKTKLLGFNL